MFHPCMLLSSYSRVIGWSAPEKLGIQQFWRRGTCSSCICIGRTSQHVCPTGFGMWLPNVNPLG